MQPARSSSQSALFLHLGSHRREKKKKKKKEKENIYGVMYSVPPEDPLLYHTKKGMDGLYKYIQEYEVYNKVLKLFVVCSIDLHRVLYLCIDRYLLCTGLLLLYTTTPYLLLDTLLSGELNGKPP